MRNPFKKAAVIGVSVAVALLGGNMPLGQGDAIAAPSTFIDIFTFNDFHGRIDEGITVAWAVTLEEAALSATAAGHDVATISAGDNIGASLFASASDQDTPTLDVLNLLAGNAALGFEASAVGNHEFDQGYADLTGRVQPYADFEYLGANVRNAADGGAALPPYYIQTLSSGLTLGIIGVVTVETPTLVSPAGVAGLRFEDPVTTVNTYANMLTNGDTSDGEADIIIAVYHEGAAVSSSLANAVAATNVFDRIVNQTSPKVAAIINGHTHLKYEWQGGTPTRPIIQTGSYGDNIGHITLEWDGSAVTGFTVANIARIAYSAPTPTNPNAKSSTQPCDSSLLSVFDTGPFADDVFATVCGAIATAAVIGNTVIAKVDADITTGVASGSYVSGKWTSTAPIATVAGADERSNESALANLVADSFLWTANKSGSQVSGGADIGIVNAGGGIRANLLYGSSGDITYAAANAVMPFVNNVWTVELTGAQFKQFLEEQWQTDGAGARPARPFLVTGLSSNVTYTVDSDVIGDEPCAYDHGGCDWNDATSHITGVFVNGEPLDEAKTYKIITLSFLTAGGDNYRVMTEGANATDTGLVDRDCWIEYLKHLSGNTGSGPTTPISPSFAHRSVVVSNVSESWLPMEPIEVVPGETTLEFSVSRLNMISQGAPAAATGVLTLTPLGGGTTTHVADLTFVAPGGDCVAEAGVSNTLNPASTGCVAISWSVPADLAAGDYVLTVEVEENGTVAQFWVLAPTGITIPTGGSLADGGELLAISALLTLAGAVLTARRKFAGLS
ncbi:MAG: 5'-nucleotidase C-terminal domain-containing protein [Propionibacteriaceae bacterium]|jgi:5'-nucleotidase|nr:5'-nucleotidase C-terminal domain-containing protein [Propionibacteriaceae bacterium]